MINVQSSVMTTTSYQPITILNTSFHTTSTTGSGSSGIGGIGSREGVVFGEEVIKPKNIDWTLFDNRYDVYQPVNHNNNNKEMTHHYHENNNNNDDDATAARWKGFRGGSVRYKVQYIDYHHHHHHHTSRTSTAQCVSSLYITLLTPTHILLDLHYLLSLISFMNFTTRYVSPHLLLCLPSLLFPLTTNL